MVYFVLRLCTSNGSGPKWTVQKTESGRSAKKDDPEIRKKTIRKETTGQSKGIKLDGPKGSLARQVYDLE